MPPVGDPRIIHGENSGDLYIHLQDMSRNLNKAVESRHSAKYGFRSPLPKFNCFTQGFSEII